MCPYKRCACARDGIGPKVALSRASGQRGLQKDQRAYYSFNSKKKKKKKRVESIN